MPSAGRREANTNRVGEEGESFYEVWFNSDWNPLAHHLPSNYIRTTKYTIWTFLPLNLFNQVSFKVTGQVFLAPFWQLGVIRRG
jgi:hypothetical protein